MQNSTTAILDTDQARYNATADAQSYLRQHGASLCDLLDALDDPAGFGALCDLHGAHSTEGGHLFHAIVGTRSTASWAAIPREGGQLV